MAEKDTIFSGKVKHKGLFDFKELYRFCYVFLVEKDYFIVEKVYTEKATAIGKEVEIEWDCKKKLTDYFSSQVKVNWRIIGMKDADVEQDGNKVTINKGEVEIKISGSLVRDYESKWETTPTLKFLRAIYDKFVIRSRIDEFEGKVYGDSDEFLGQVKAFIGLEGKH